MKTTAKPKTRKAPPTWWAKTITASDLVGVIRDDLDNEEELDGGTLRTVAECVAGKFDFTDAERAEFVAFALANQEGRAGEDD